MKDKLVVSVSGGETSMFMAYYLKENYSDKYEMIFIMANTSEENEESLEFAHKCDQLFGLNLVWVEAIINYGIKVNGRVHHLDAKRYNRMARRVDMWKIDHVKSVTTSRVVSYETACRNGRVFEDMIAKYGIPNVKFKHCTRELKERPIRDYCISIGWDDYYIAIGYRIDEIDRINVGWKEKKHIYPLIVWMPMTKPAINRFWINMPFRLTLKGYEDNCKVCHKKSLRKLLTIAKNTPERFDNVIIWQHKYEWHKSGASKTKKRNKPLRFYRNNLTVEEILSLAQEKFEEAPDDRVVTIEYIQTMLFGYDLDQSGGGCGSESCEAFS